MKITKSMLRKAEIAVSDFLDERVPASALPGGAQLFADPNDHLDPHFKHEKGCADLALVVLTAALTRAKPIR